LQFITRSVRFGVEYPGNIAVVIIEQAESDIGIPNVNNDGIHVK
jgi:hypothetical protein